ncbi:hypothetical protein M2275_005792 [Rhodococcus opacus]|nr:hypothetical protein [Rhodococcus opacus]
MAGQTLLRKTSLRKLLAEAKQAGWLNKDGVVAYQRVKGRVTTTTTRW